MLLFSRQSPPAVPLSPRHRAGGAGEVAAQPRLSGFRRCEQFAAALHQDAIVLPGRNRTTQCSRRSEEVSRREEKEKRKVASC